MIPYQYRWPLLSAPYAALSIAATSFLLSNSLSDFSPRSVLSPDTERWPVDNTAHFSSSILPSPGHLPRRNRPNTGGTVPRRVEPLWTMLLFPCTPCKPATNLDRPSAPTPVPPRLLRAISRRAEGFLFLSALLLPATSHQHSTTSPVAASFFDVPMSLFVSTVMWKGFVSLHAESGADKAVIKESEADEEKKRREQEKEKEQWEREGERERRDKQHEKLDAQGEDKENEQVAAKRAEDSRVFEGIRHSAVLDKPPLIVPAVPRAAAVAAVSVSACCSSANAAMHQLPMARMPTKCPRPNRKCCGRRKMSMHCLTMPANVLDWPSRLSRRGSIIGVIMRDMS
ncbi:hypothetical protein R3P38DRAFT_3227320 [Favolaschia claudopus]|uniref:Uncharacterized protein n=1 Tax=Favolaschia claudopus TaxID=2862362 RepID=A0AAV9ZSV9_9AGAR